MPPGLRKVIVDTINKDKFQLKRIIAYKNKKRSRDWLQYYYALHSAFPNSLHSLKLRAFSIVTTAIACKASRVKNAW